jgi:hypothetical protein
MSGMSSDNYKERTLWSKIDNIFATAKEAFEDEDYTKWPPKHVLDYAPGSRTITTDVKSLIAFAYPDGDDGMQF